MARVAGDIENMNEMFTSVLVFIFKDLVLMAAIFVMLARLNPLGVIPAAFFFAVIITGAEAMSRATGVPVFLADVMQGTALIAMLVALLFTRYRLRIRRFSNG